MRQRRGPNIRVPPAIFLAGFLVGLWLESVWRVRVAGGDARMLSAIGWAVALLGLAMSLWGVFTFRNAGTTMFPFEPASRLVRHGPYRFTRNPMYLGATVSYAGVALAMNVAWPLLLLPLVLWALYVSVIREEERYLDRLFGDEYAAYKRSVRRWI